MLAHDPDGAAGCCYTRRDAVKLAALSGIALTIPPCVMACLDKNYTTGLTTGVPPGHQTPSPIEGYADATSYRWGETASFHISSDLYNPRVKAQIIRLGMPDELVRGPWSQRVDPQVVPSGASRSGCGWPVTFDVTIPNTWRTGVYLVQLSSFYDANVATDIPFVVKPLVRQSSILYQIPVATYQAYNGWGGTSLYTLDAQGYSHPFVSFDRPYEHVRLFRGLDLPFIRWMEGAGYTADFCTSIDLHGDPALRLSGSGYRLLISVGHDEYWSWEMRDNVEGFVETGGNVAFFGGNTCWWQIRLEPDARRIVCYKDSLRSQRDPAWGWGPEGQRRVTTHWFSPPVNRPEERMTGLSFRYGAFWGSQEQKSVPFHPGPADHWVFAGLSFGSDGLAPGVVGAETDAAHLRLNADGSCQVDSHNVPIISEASDDGQVGYGPPDSIMVLASTNLLSWPGKSGRATMAIYRDSGVVFNAATLLWASALDASEQVRIITANVLRGLTTAFPPSPPLVNLGFEVWSPLGQPAGWDGGVGEQGVPQVFQETRGDLTRTGTSSLRINAQSGYARLSQDFMATSGRYYVVSGWIRSSEPIQDNDGHWLTIKLEDAESPDAAFATAAYFATDGGWQHVRAYGRAPSNGPMLARITIESVFSGDAWFDELRVDLL